MLMAHKVEGRNAMVDLLVCPIKGLLQRLEHRSTRRLFAEIDSFQHFRALTTYSQALEVFKERIEGWDDIVE